MIYRSRVWHVEFGVEGAGPRFGFEGCGFRTQTSGPRC